jgi:hypothetical protein
MSTGQDVSTIAVAARPAPATQSISILTREI